MKFYLKPILTVIALAVLLGYSGCGGSKNPGPSVEEVQLGKITGTWKVDASNSSSDVTLGGVSKRTDYNGFTLVLTGSAGSTYNFVKSGGPTVTPFPANGTWKFGTDPEKDIIIATGAQALTGTYSVTDTSLEITFSYTGTGESSRTTEVKGTWVFKLVK